MELILTISLIHLVACLSTGPDIFLVVLNSLRHGWRTGVATTGGILSGVALHIALGITGISLLLAQGEVAESLIGLAGGAWLIYLGAKGMLSPPAKPLESAGSYPSTACRPRHAAAWLQGLLVNLLNPKALLFFLSIFAVMLGPEVSVPLKAGAGAAMIGVQAAAFSLVAFLVDRPGFKARWTRLQLWLERAISLVLIFLGLWIWLHTLLQLAG
jgi:threonine efflux protein